jgi:hypothetical protein
VTRLWREERGQASTELMGMTFWLVLGALFIWQLMLGAWTVNQTSNAARTASRVAAHPGGDPEKAARNALSAPLRGGFHDFRMGSNGETATVHVRIPIIMPGITAAGFTATRSATLPN